MKKLPLFVIACLLVSVTTWAGWSIVTEKQYKSNYIFARTPPPIACSADGKIIYLTYVGADVSNAGSGYTSISLFKSTDGGETWVHQQFAPVLNPAK